MAFDQRSLIHREAWFPGGPSIPKHPIFLKNGKNYQKRKNSKKSRYANISDTPFGIQVSNPSGSVVSTMFLKAKSAKKQTFFFAPQFQTASKQKCYNLRPLLSITFPQGFRISKNIGHPTSGSGGKKTFKRYLKSEHTDRQTYKQTDRPTDILTYRKHRPRVPML